MTDLRLGKSDTKTNRGCPQSTITEKTKRDNSGSQKITLDISAKDPMIKKVQKDTIYI